jgi:heat shock protein HtpX
VFAILGLLLAILAPIAATLMQLAISRKREFLADASGALLTRYPDALASALQKIAGDPTPMDHPSHATAHLWLTNPFKEEGGPSFLTRLFMTHPPIEERIAALKGMEV